MAEHGTPPTLWMKKKWRKGWMSAVRVVRVVKVVKVAKADLAAKLAVKPVVKLDLPKVAKAVPADQLKTLAKEDLALSQLMVVQRLSLPSLTSTSRTSLISE